MSEDTEENDPDEKRPMKESYELRPRTQRTLVHTDAPYYARYFLRAISHFTHGS